MRDLEHDSIDIVGYLLGCDACGRKKIECDLSIWHLCVCLCAHMYACGNCLSKFGKV